MRKFSFFLAAMCCVMMSLVSVQSAKAEILVTGITPIDSIDAPRYITDIKFDPETRTLEFNDTYKNDEVLNRMYWVYVYYRTKKTSLYSWNATQGGKTQKKWEYGFPDDGHNTLVGGNFLLGTVENSKGGYMSWERKILPDGFKNSFDERFQQGLAEGYVDFRICIEPK